MSAPPFSLPPVAASADITLITAVAMNGVIGADGRMPWRLPADRARFNRLTGTKPILMGRRTWEYIGKALPGRLNLVLTRDPAWRGHGAMRVGSLDEALRVSSGIEAKELMVIGGAEVFREALPKAVRIHLTRVHTEAPGDARFPDLEPGEWIETEREERPADEQHAWAMTFVTLERVR
jgi:dihydrofolate reductase